MAAVHLRGVSKSYSGRSQEELADPANLAVKQVDLNVRDGEFVVLVGPSGCGKTTTLRMIAGLEDVSGGEISIGNRVVNHVPPRERNIAMVFQNYALYPHMNVYRNMAFGLELRYRSDWWSRLWLAVTQPQLAAELAKQRRGIPQRVQQTAEMLGIQNLLQRKPVELSGGEKQRVALGRAIVRQPAAFLFDEPLSNLDAQLRTDMRREIKRLHSELKATMIYVTHDQVEAMTLGDRVVVMNQGEVRQIGTPLEVYDQPADLFVAGFIGSPPMNLIEGEIRKSNNGWNFTCPALDICGLERALRTTDLNDGAKITLGVRAEAVRIAEVSDQPEDEEAQIFVIDVVESLGDATVIHAHAKNGEEITNITAKIRNRISLVRGDRVECEFLFTSLHWFDSNTGKRINAK